jgi:tetratricopeptide (TPR) repeat protein|tara:strand:- start:644 stop:1489 length:846 start_codon:yes stop_codon:yes gene_type:complete
MKNKNHLKQEKLYNQILKNDPDDYFAMKCLIDIFNELGKTEELDEHHEKLSNAKENWIGDYKSTANGKYLSQIFSDLENGKINCGEGQLKSWSEFWDDLIRSADIYSAEFHYYRSEETVGPCSAIYLEIAKLIDENGIILDEILLFRAEEIDDIEEARDLGVLLLEKDPTNSEALRFLAMDSFENLSEQTIGIAISLFETIYRECNGWADSEIMLRLGICYASAGDVCMALKLLKKIEKTERRAERRHWALGKIPKSEKPSHKLSFIIGSIIKEIESKNIN